MSIQARFTAVPGHDCDDAALRASSPAPAAFVPWKVRDPGAILSVETSQ